jgi:hypothetical protein
MKSILALTLALALSSCASTPAEPVADGNRAACSRDAPIGSTIAVARCRSADQAHQDRKEAESVATEIRRSSGGAHAGPNGQ